MAKRYKPRDIDESQNPFIQDLQIGVIERHTVKMLSDLDNVIQDTELGIITSMGETLTKSHRFHTETDRFVVEYSEYGDIDLCEVRNGLSPGALRMYDFVKQCLRKNKTLVHIAKEAYMDQYGIKSQTTFIAHRDELVSSKIITPSVSSFQGWYWVNPVFVFCGSRMSTFKDKKVIQEAKPKQRNK